MDSIRKQIRSELEAPAESRVFGSGWISGVLALIFAAASLAGGLCVRFPGVFTVSELHTVYNHIPYRLILQGFLVVSFLFALLSLALRQKRTLGLTALVGTLFGIFLIQTGEPTSLGSSTPYYLGLDWFVLNIFFTGAIFIPLEKLFPQVQQQGLFRIEWREDLFYYFVSSLLVQVFTYLSLWPALTIAHNTEWTSLRSAVAAQPFWLQVLEIMFLTDFMQYWIHRLFHQIPWLWKFHAVHHSAKAMDWMAGARMHFIEIVVLRGFTVIPMQILGFDTSAIQIYILIVYVYSTLLHANIRWSPQALSGVLATPRFHHWHHGIEKEAIDVNFAIHFPLFDKVFGTYHMPKGEWPSGYGIGGHPVPLGYVKQFLYPFASKKK